MAPVYPAQVVVKSPKVSLMTDLLGQLRHKEMELLAQKATIEDALREIRAGIQVAVAITQSKDTEEPKE